MCTKQGVQRTPVSDLKNVLLRFVGAERGPDLCSACQVTRPTAPVAHVRQKVAKSEYRVLYYNELYLYICFILPDFSPTFSMILIIHTVICGVLDISIHQPYVSPGFL